ncbi:MAG: GntR family transcriptional regulator [Bacteroidia bacterium]
MARILQSRIDQIDENSRMPKYRQVINTILRDIDQNHLQPGERIPSINETSEEYYLSRDTVEKAYRELSKRGVITSIPGKGYYVNTSPDLAKLKVLVIFNKLSNYKQAIYSSFVKTLGKHAVTNLYVYGHDYKFFESIILDNLSEYDYYVVMPHFYEYAAEASRVLKKIPRNKLLLIDRKPDNLPGNYGIVYQDFQRDIQDGLRSGLPILEKYSRFCLVFPEDTPYPPEIKAGFQAFCEQHGIAHAIIPSLERHNVQAGDAYLVVLEQDLIHLIKASERLSLPLGDKLGIISYNDTPVLDVLAGGITVITTDHAQMGQTAADMILNKRRDVVRNPFYLIRRKSL